MSILADSTAWKHKSSIPAPPLLELKSGSFQLMSKIKPNGAFKRFLTTLNVTQTLKIIIFLQKVAGFLTTCQIPGSKQAGWQHRYGRGQRPLEYTLSKFYFTAVTFQYAKWFLVKEGSVHTRSAPEWRDPINLGKKPGTEEIQSVFTGQSRTSSMAATGSLLYRRHWLYGGERVLVKALPATWWEIPARPQHLHGSAET